MKNKLLGSGYTVEKESTASRAQLMNATTATSFALIFIFLTLFLKFLSSFLNFLFSPLSLSLPSLLRVTGKESLMYTSH